MIPGIVASQTRSTALEAPQTITGLQLWFAANRLSMLDGDLVETWADSSDNARHATQATEANRPTFKTAILGGKPIVRFSGSHSLATSVFTAMAQPSTIFVVAKTTQTAGSNTAFIDGLDTSNRHQLGITSSGDIHTMSAGVFVSGGARDVNFNVLNAVYNGASSSLRKNGTQIISGDAGAQSLTGLIIGRNAPNTQPLTGDIAEIVMYNRLLTTDERSTLEGYLGDKYGITIS